MPLSKVQLNQTEPKYENSPEAFSITTMSVSIVKSYCIYSFGSLRYKILRLMDLKFKYKRNIGSVVVVENTKSDRNNPNKKRLYGIFTERDLLTKVLPKDVCLNEEVKGYCSTQPLTAPIGITAIEAAKIMLIRKIKRIPLVTEVEAKGAIGKGEASISSETIQNDDKYNLVAIVTARDLVEVFESR
jgi:CBS domain-containing protein